MKQLLGVLRGVNKNNQSFGETQQYRIRTTMPESANQRTLVVSIEEGTLYRIGKDEGSDIRINIEDLICDTHCVIASASDSLNSVPNVYLTDTSTTGTYLDACLIGQNKTVLLYSGCIISFASMHINLQYTQYAVDDERFPALAMTFQPGYLSSPIQQENTGREISIRSTKKDIGSGNQSFILLAYDKDNPNCQLACKYTNLRGSCLKPWVIRAYKTEIKILKSNKHPNVLSLVALHENQEEVFAFSPLYYGGSLQERLNNSDPRLNQMNERNATFLINQLFAGLDYLHDKDIIHCDLKPSNILLSDRYTDRPRLVIADFGHSMQKSNKPKTWPEDWGTLAYHAPEMVQLKEFSDKVDSWAAGIIFYQMLVGNHPFDSCEARSLEEAIVMQEIELSPAIFTNISPPSRQIIAQLTQKNQHQRPTIKQAMQIKTLFSWFVGDDKVANDHYLREREQWFGEAEWLSSPPKCTKQHTVQDDNVGLPEAVETIKKYRNPSDSNTFLHAKQTGLSAYGHTLVNRLNRQTIRY
ncbi:uncharacterized protein ATC70_002238 [Mucor velutinosus]|uniref:Non-specific serine/threonine protein kinase n=1 Tax=Mucor velutinosus TaxID=708070 RepID=A0AAN7DBY2_9FUNG|nr:hypothetical protein ATC70_002238 [Mucor velutinosus]